MTSAVFRSMVDRRSYRVAFGSGRRAYFWANLNPLFGVYRGAIGWRRVLGGWSAFPAGPAPRSWPPA